MKDMYIVWYNSDLGRSIWGIYRTEEEGNTVVQYILNNDFASEAWCNGENYGALLNY